MRRRLFLIAVALTPAVSAAQGFPPEKLVNVQVIPDNTPVINVIGQMRNFAGDLGVRCQFCHVGQEGLPLEKFDFASDEKRPKLVARQMMRMVQEINRRVDTLPGHEANSVRVTCATCHRGVSRPVPLSAVLVEIGTTSTADSAVRAYKALRNQYYGRAAYDFGESSLNIAAFRLGRANKFDASFALLKVNEEYFPGSSGLSVFRGNVFLMKGDTASAEASYRDAVKRDQTNEEAKGRLRDIGRQP
jgi:hypothetical protein